MKRRLFNIWAAISLLLFLAVIVMWIRSHFRTDVIGWMRYGGAAPHGYLDYQVSSVPGVITMARMSSEGYPHGGNSPWPTGRHYHSWGAARIRAVGVFGLGFWRRGGGGPVATHGLLIHSFAVTYWLLALLSALAPAVWLRRALRERLRRWRSAHGLCIWCGYDLTGNPSGVCSECGAAVAH